MAITPTEDYRLVSFLAPPGYRVAHLRRTALPAERWAWTISGAALLLTMLAGLTARRRPA